MTKDYIEREAAELALTADVTDLSIEDYISRVSKRIKALPSADVKPVVHGKWHDCYELIDGTFVGTCSACGKTKKSLYPVMDNYCAECGATMDADMRGNAND